MTKGARKKRQRSIPLERLINDAAKRGNLSEVRKLVESGVDVNGREDFGGFRPLISAAANGHLNVVKYLVAQGAQIDAVIMDRFPVEHQGATALMMACHSGHFGIVEELLKAGADHSKNVSKNESPTPITSAARAGHLDIVRLLLRSGAMLPSFALYGATWNSHAGVVAELLKAGADISFKDVTGRPLMLVACSGPAEGKRSESVIAIVKSLVSAGAEIDGGDIANDTPLMATIRAKNHEVMRFLVQAGANVNARSISGTTPLHYAALTGQTDLARVLVQAGADPFAKDCEGESPMDLAKKNKELLRVLKEAASNRAKA